MQCTICHTPRTAHTLRGPHRTTICVIREGGAFCSAYYEGCTATAPTVIEAFAKLGITFDADGTPRDMLAALASAIGVAPDIITTEAHKAREKVANTKEPKP